MIVDAHAHLVPAELLAEIRKGAAKFPNVRQIEDGGSLALAFAGGKPTRPVSKPLSDIPSRLAWLAKNGIDKQVVGGWVDMFGYELPGAESEAWSRLANDAMLAAAKAEPHFVPLATVPLGDGVRAAAVLKDAIKAGFTGAMIGTLPRGVGSTLDAADLDPFWRAADETGALHSYPSELRRRRRAGERFRSRQWARPHHRCRRGDGAADLGRTCREVQTSEILRAHGRGRAALRARPPQAQCRDHTRCRRSGRGLAAIYTDTILHDARALKFVIEMLGTERLMMGSDMPFPIGDLEPMKSSRLPDCPRAQAVSINGGLAARLFRLQ